MYIGYYIVYNQNRITYQKVYFEDTGVLDPKCTFSYYRQSAGTITGQRLSHVNNQPVFGKRVEARTV